MALLTRTKHKRSKKGDTNGEDENRKDIRRFIGKAVNMDDLVRHANRDIYCDYGYRRM